MGSPQQGQGRTIVGKVCIRVGEGRGVVRAIDITSSSPGLVSVPPTLRAGSIKMKQSRSSQRAASKGILAQKDFALPSRPQTGGTYGEKRQEAHTCPREHAYHPSPCRRHRCGSGGTLGVCAGGSRCPAHPEI